MTAPLALPDIDPQETREWLDALESVIALEGRPRAHYLLDRLADLDAARHGDLHGRVTTAYVNTVPRARQPAYPGDLALERRLNAMIRWNAMVMVLRAGRHSNVGGHIATYQSAAVLYDVGFDHFFRGRTGTFDGDMVYIQGHSAPGIYGRAYLEGRITDAQLDNFRRETGREAGRDGLSSYPHPRLMPAFWQFPTVSMGLGPLTAAYQARFMRYLEYRGLKAHQGRKVWAFLGDGEMDQPESLAAISLAGREQIQRAKRVRPSAATSVNMCAASLISARLFVHQPPTSSATHSRPVTTSPVRTAPSSLAWSRLDMADSESRRAPRPAQGAS